MECDERERERESCWLVVQVLVSLSTASAEATETAITASKSTVATAAATSAHLTEMIVVDGLSDQELNDKAFLKRGKKTQNNIEKSARVLR